MKHSSFIVNSLIGLCILTSGVAIAADDAKLETTDLEQSPVQAAQAESFTAQPEQSAQPETLRSWISKNNKKVALASTAVAASGLLIVRHFTAKPLNVFRLCEITLPSGKNVLQLINEKVFKGKGREFFIDSKFAASLLNKTQ